MVEFTLQGQGFSINRTYYKNRAVKTTEAKHWEAGIQAQLEEIKELTEFAMDWNAAPSPNGIEMRVMFEVPAHIYFTKDKQISARSMDLDNQAKILIDSVFGHRLQINDKVISKLVLEKQAGPCFQIKIRLLIR